jgi:hypothetical protein
MADAQNEYRFAAELAQDANHAAEDGRRVYERFSYLQERKIEWDRTIAPQRATMLAFVILFPVIAFVEYLFSEELYRDILPNHPWAIGLIFAVVAVIIAEMLVYRFFDVKRQWKANELKRSDKWKNKVDDLIDRHIKTTTRIQFFIGIILMMVMLGILSYMSWDRVKRMFSAGESVYGFKPADTLPIILYAFEIVTGMFIWYVILRIELGFRVSSLKKRFDNNVKKCSELTINAVETFDKAEKLKYDIFDKAVARSIQEALCRNDGLGEANGIDYINELKSGVFEIELNILHHATNIPFIGNVKVATNYKFTNAEGTNNGNLVMKLATILRVHPEEGNMTDDSIRTIYAEYEINGKPVIKEVKVDIDMDIRGPHTIYI